MVSLLSVAHDIAKSSLATSSQDSAVVSRNIARAGDPEAARKTLQRETVEGGGVRGVSVQRAVDTALYDGVLSWTSKNAASEQRVAALDVLSNTIGDPALGGSPSSYIAELSDSLQVYAASPHNDVAGDSAVAAAKNVVRSLNAAAEAVIDVRDRANSDLADAVEQLGTLLEDFERLNNEVVGGTRLGEDVTDAMDERDSVLRDISELIGIRVVGRPGNDLVLYSSDGATLFETVPRTLDYNPNLGVTLGTTGAPLRIDGIAVGANGALSDVGGKIGALLEVRDETALTYGRQLDEIARGLIETFAETDQSPTPTLPAVAGLFTDGSTANVPPSGVVVDGLAATISVNANLDSTVGGNVRLLRDGGAGLPANPAYVANPTSLPGFTDRLQGLVAGLNSDRAFDAASEISSDLSVMAFSSGSVAWLEGQRQTASNQAEENNIRLTRTQEAWNNKTGINLDDQMAALIDLERSYQASARLMSTLDQMFDTLLRVAE